MTRPGKIKTIVRQWIEQGWQDGDPTVVDRLHAPDFIDHDPGGRAPDNAGFKAGIEALFTAFPDLQTRIQDIIVDAEAQAAAVRWTATGTHRQPYLGAAPTDKTITFKGIEIVRIEGGRITERWGEWDGIDLLAQLGAKRAD